MILRVTGVFHREVGEGVEQEEEDSVYGLAGKPGIPNFFIGKVQQLFVC